MVSPFDVIFDEFEEEAQAILGLVEAPDASRTSQPRSRIAAANAAVLLLAATFEEFIREMARAYARAVVESCASYDRLPPKMAPVAWRRTMEALARFQLDPQTQVFSRESVFSDAQTLFTVVYDFCRGDLTQDIYEHLIHNENNMRPQEINAMFKVSGLKNTCMAVSADEDLKALLGETEQNLAYEVLISRIDAFFERRNQVAHSLRAMRSSGPAQITDDIGLLRTFGKALAATLNSNAPPPHERMIDPGLRGMEAPHTGMDLDPFRADAGRTE